MPRHFVRTACTLTLAALQVAIVAIMFTPNSEAQVEGNAASSASASSLAALKFYKRQPRAGSPEYDNPFFLPAVDYDSGAWGAGSVVVADLNKDGKLDAVVVNDGGGLNFDGTVGVLLGNGDGSFQPVVLYDSGGWQPAWIAIADVNGDGVPDLIVANACGGVTNCNVSGSVGVLLGNGNGTFQPAVTYDSGGLPASGVAVADLNGDGKADVVTTNCGTAGGSCFTNGEGIVGVLLGKGDGTFKTAVTYDLNRIFGTFGADQVAIADVDQDGFPDLVVGTSSGIAVLLGNGDGTFSPQNIYHEGTFPPTNWPVVADVNGDGIPDILSVNHYSYTANVLIGQGHGAFAPAVSYDVNRGHVIYPVSIAVADVNGDGRQDLVVGMDGGGAAVLPGNGDGTFQTAVVYQSAAHVAAVADLNHDGKIDVVGAGGGAPCCDGVVSILINNRQGPPYTPTATALTSSANPATRKELFSYTVLVTNQTAGPVSGSVTLFQNNVAIATLTLTDNQAFWTLSYTHSGTYKITAAYSGDASNGPSTSATLLQYVGVLPVASHTSVSTTQSHSIYGNAVTFTARVTWVGGVAPDGESVTFSDGVNPIGTSTTTGGVARITTAALIAGTHFIGASYVGDTKLKPSHGQVTQVVALPPVAAQTVVSTSGSPSLSGQPVTFTAHVSSQYGLIPNGELVTFYDGSGEIGTAKTTSGAATFTTSSLTATTHTIKATYAGDGTFKKSSGTVTQVVDQ